MADNRGDFNAPPWWKDHGPEDYTRTRTGDIGYTIDDIIGRKDVNKYKLVTDDPTTISGLPDSVLI